MGGGDGLANRKKERKKREKAKTKAKNDEKFGSFFQLFDLVPDHAQKGHTHAKKQRGKVTHAHTRQPSKEHKGEDRVQKKEKKRGKRVFRFFFFRLRQKEKKKRKRRRDEVFFCFSEGSFVVVLSEGKESEISFCFSKD